MSLTLSFFSVLFLTLCLLFLSLSLSSALLSLALGPYLMRKLFASSKKSKKPGDLKIPIPLLGGSENSRLTESQIDYKLTGRRKRRNDSSPKLASSISEDTRNKSAFTTQTQQRRPISSPPALAMPKPRRQVPPTHSVLRSERLDKTLVDDGNNNNNRATMPNIVQRQQLLEHPSPPGMCNRRCRPNCKLRLIISKQRRQQL